MPKTGGPDSEARPVVEVCRPGPIQSLQDVGSPYVAPRRDTRDLSSIPFLPVDAPHLSPVLSGCDKDFYDPRPLVTRYRDEGDPHLPFWTLWGIWVSTTFTTDPGATHLLPKTEVTVTDVPGVRRPDVDGGQGPEPKQNLGKTYSGRRESSRTRRE